MDSGTTLPHPLRARRGAAEARTGLRQRIAAHAATLALGGITAAGLGLRLWGLADKSLWIDETFSVGMVQQGWGSFLHTVARVQPNMELFYLLLKLQVVLTPTAWGGNEAFWRLLPALAGTATIPATYALARRLFTTAVALSAAALVAVNEFLVEYSQQARGYTLFVLLLTLSYLALVRWLAGERRALVAFAALVVLGFLTQAFEVVFLTAQLAFVALVLLRRRVPLGRLALALVPLGGIVALRYPVYAAHPDQVAWIKRPSLSDLFLGVRQLVGGDGGSPNRAGDALLLLVLVGCVVLVAWGLRHLLHPHSERDGTTQPLRVLHPLHPLRVASLSLAPHEAAALVVLWFALPIALTWLGSQVKPIWVPRYLAPCAVPACIILAAALHMFAARLASLVAVMRKGQRAINCAPTFPLSIRRWGGGWGVGLVLLLALAPLHDYQARPGWEDWRGAAASVAARSLPGDGTVCYDNQWGCDFGFSTYFASDGGTAHLDPAAPGAFSWATYARPDREAIFARAVAPAALSAYLARHARVWVLLGHDTAGAGDPRAGLAWLRAHAHLASATVFPGDIGVYLFIH